MSIVRILGPTMYTRPKKRIKKILPIKKTANFDFGAALLSKFDVLDNIFSYLSFKDLCSVAQINELWSNCTELELRKRLRPVLFTYGLTCCKAPESVYSKPLITVIIIKCNDMKLHNFVCLHKGKKKEERKTVIESIQDDLLTQNCPIIALTCRQILSSFTSNILLNGIVFPNIPNINISIFKIGEPTNEISNVLSKSIQEDNHILCLLAFGICCKKRQIHELIHRIEERQPSYPFAFGGGFVRGVQSFNNPKANSYHRKDDYLCVAFTKPINVDVNFNAYSIIIPELNSDEDIEQYFIDLKSHYKARKYGIAFRITCISAQDEVEKEVKLFKKHFPNIDIIGFDGDGEIGWDCYKIGTSEPKKRKTERPKIFHSFTAVIVLLTWGKPMQ